MSSSGAFELKAEHETVFFNGAQKCLNSGICIAKQESGANCGAIADAQPDHLRRTSTQNAQFGKVGILGDDGKAVLPGVIPDLVVGGIDQVTVLNVRRAGVQIA